MVTRFLTWLTEGPIPVSPAPTNHKQNLYKQCLGLLINGKQHTTRQRFTFYRRLFIVSSCAIWVFLTLFITIKPPVYISEWTLILPGSGDGHAVNLESVGQASSKVASPFTNSSLDPSVNYKAIALSYPVLSRAANSLSIPLSDFGRPKIKLVDQTSLMLFKIKADTAEQAQKKALALYDSLQFQLDKLRDDEQHRINDAGLSSMASFSDKLKAAQQQKVIYQTQSGIVSIEQFNQLVERLENERAALSGLVTRFDAISEKIEVIQESLALSDQQVKQAVNLRNDVLFQDYLKRHAEIHSQISTIKGTWGANHPKLKHLEAAHHTVNHDIVTRGQKLINNSSTSIWSLIEMGSTQFENTLLADLIMLKSEQRQMQSEVASTKATIERLQQRVDKSTRDVITIEDLTRKQQVATAVFTTALAKQDIGKADRFASYPLVQMLAEPSLPQSADKLATQLAIVGGIFANLFLLISLILLWHRKPWLQKLQKKK